MGREAGAHLVIGGQYGADRFRCDTRLLVDRRRGDQALDIDFIGVEQKPDERLLVVRVRLDVGQDDQAVGLGPGGVLRDGGRAEAGETDRDKSQPCPERVHPESPTVTMNACHENRRGRHIV